MRGVSRITVIQGHPDVTERHLCHALADAYCEGARSADIDVEVINVAELDFPLIKSKSDFEEGACPISIKRSQAMINTSDHFVLIYPLWLGTMPALTKGFLEQVFRYEFAFDKSNGHFDKKLKGLSARIMITMGMPAPAYRWFYKAHSLKSLERNVLKFAGIGPIRENLFGMVDNVSAEKHERWLNQVRKLGAQGL